MNCEIESCEHRATQEAIVMFTHKPGGPYYCSPSPARICKKHAATVTVSMILSPQAFQVIQNEAPRKGQPKPIIEHCKVKLRPMPEGGRSKRAVGASLERPSRKRELALQRYRERLAFNKRGDEDN